MRVKLFWKTVRITSPFNILNGVDFIVRIPIEDLKSELYSDISSEELDEILKEMGATINNDGTVDIPDEHFDSNTLTLEGIRKSHNMLIEKVNQHSEAFRKTLDLIKTLNTSTDEQIEMLGEATKEAFVHLGNLIDLSFGIFADINNLEPLNGIGLDGYFKNISLEKYISYYISCGKTIDVVYPDIAPKAENTMLDRILLCYLNLMKAKNVNTLNEYLTQNHDELMIMTSLAHNTDMMEFKELKYLVYLFTFIKENALDIFHQYLSDEEYESLMQARIDKTPKEVCE